MIDKDVVAAFLEEPRKSFDFMKRMTRADLVEEVRAEVGYWPFKGRRPDLHQIVCFLIGLIRPHFLYLLDMSAGKTWIILLLFKHYKRQGKVSQLLSLVPKKVHIGSWENEVELVGDLTYEGIDVQNIESKWNALINSTADVTVIDYQGFELATTKKIKQGKRGKLIRDEDKVKALVRKYNAITLDEIHRCKNHMSLRYAIVRMLTKHAYLAHGLTGTPTDKDPEGLWAQFHLIDGGEALGKTLGVYRQAFFKKRSSYFGGDEWEFDKAMLPTLRRFIKHSSIRYRDDEFSDLAPIVHIPPTVFRLPVPQRNAYAALAKGRVIDGIRVPIDGVYHKMRRICSGYEIIVKNGVTVTVPFDENPKLDDLETFLEELPDDRKALIFFEYTESGRMVTEVLRKRKVGHLLLDGSTKNPRGIEKEFNTQAKNQVLVLQNSCSEGLNVQTANYEYFFEEPTSAITWAQALKRTHRRGQQHRVFIRAAHARGTVETSLHSALKDGRDFLRDLSSNAKGTQRGLFDMKGL